MENSSKRVPLPSLSPEPSPATPPPAAPPPTPSSPVSVPELTDRVNEVLRTCYDPEIPVNIYELGLVYDVDVSPAGEVIIQMTLTSPACPVAGSLPGEIEYKVRAIPGVTSAKVVIVWDPPWTQDRMSDEAKLQLGLF